MILMIALTGAAEAQVPDMIGSTTCRIFTAVKLKEISERSLQSALLHQRFSGYVEGFIRAKGRDTEQIMTLTSIALNEICAKNPRLPMRRAVDAALKRALN
ncbi:MAG: hypothetical protein AAGI03_00660 [Pseudomonadota bacterium]